MKIGNREFDFDKNAYVMGILNVTPDSFSDGGSYSSVKNAVDRAKKMIEEGVDIIDIGGESTRPGHTPVSDEEELKRVIPVIEAIRNFSDIPISLDTFKANTLKKGIEYGIDLANDVWGLTADEKMAKVISDANFPVVIMHNKRNNSYENLILDMKKELLDMVNIAKEAGISDDRIILDPGLGFALSYEKDLAVLNNLDSFLDLNYPILLGASRKRFIGRATGVENPKERLIGTVSTTIFGYMKGARIFRVHDVRENIEALKMIRAIEMEGNDER